MNKRNISIAWIIIILWIYLFYSVNVYLIQKEAVKLHNLWNEEFRTDNLVSALDYYSWSLSIQDHPDTRLNYYYVKKLLEEDAIESQTEESWQNNSNSVESEASETDSSSNESWDSSDQSDTSTNQNTTNWSASERSEEYLLEQDKEISEMTDEERELLEKTLEDLENNQLFQQRYYDKKPSEQIDPFEEMQKRFFWEIYRWWEKDW